MPDSSSRSARNAPMPGRLSLASSSSCHPAGALARDERGMLPDVTGDATVAGAGAGGRAVVRGVAQAASAKLASAIREDDFMGCPCPVRGGRNLAIVHHGGEVVRQLHSPAIDQIRTAAGPACVASTAALVALEGNAR